MGGFSSVPTQDEADAAALRREQTPTAYSPNAGTLSGAPTYSAKDQAFGAQFGGLPSQDGMMVRAVRGASSQPDPVQRGLPTPLSDSGLNYGGSSPQPTTVLGDQGRGVPVGHNPPPLASSASTPSETGIRRIDTGHGPLFTNVDGNAAAMGGLNAPQSMTTTNLADANAGLARANAIRQSMLDNPDLGGGGPRVAMLPSSQSSDTQKLFDKWANEALVKDLVSRQGGAGAAASVFNNGADNIARMAQLGLQGQNQFANTMLANQGHLAGIGLQGQNQLANTQLMADSQMGLQGLRNEGDANRARIDQETRTGVQRLTTEGRLSEMDKEMNARKEMAAAGGLDKHLDTIPKVLEAMNPKDPNYTQLMNMYTQGLLGRFSAQQPQAQQPQSIQAAPPQAIEMLKKSPELAAQFDQKYGQGASKQFIGG